MACLAEIELVGVGVGVGVGHNLASDWLGQAHMLVRLIHVQAQIQHRLSPFRCGAQ